MERNAPRGIGCTSLVILTSRGADHFARAQFVGISPHFRAETFRPTRFRRPRGRRC